MDLFDSALAHQIPPEDSLYVVEHPWRAMLMREEPRKVLYLGFSPSGQPLEVMVAETVKFGEVVIHSMPMRKKYRKLLERGRSECLRYKED